jgi:hypothetical protein
MDAEQFSSVHPNFVFCQFLPRLGSRWRRLSSPFQEKLNSRTLRNSRLTPSPNTTSKRIIPPRIPQQRWRFDCPGRPTHAWQRFKDDDGSFLQLSAVEERILNRKRRFILVWLVAITVRYIDTVRNALLHPFNKGADLEWAWIILTIISAQITSIVLWRTQALRVWFGAAAPWYPFLDQDFLQKQAKRIYVEDGASLFGLY